MRSLQQNRIISSSINDSIFESIKPVSTQNFNQNSSLISLLTRIGNQTDKAKTPQNIESHFSFPSKITIIYKSPNNISPHLNCPICYQIYTTPTRLYCGHTFCYKCLETIFNGDKIGGSRLTDDRTCPICRELIDKNKVGKDFIADAIIQEFLVICPREECPWQGMKKELENHYKIQCAFKKSQKEKPIWHTVFPQHAPKQNVQIDPVVKGSLLARIYANSKDLQQKSSFDELKQKMTGQNFQNQDKSSKRQKRLQKQKQKQFQDLNRRIECKIRELDEFEQTCRLKTPQELQSQYQELQRKKTKQKMEKRQKNISELQKLLKQTQYQTIVDNKRMNRQKQAFLKKQRIKNTEIEENFNLKLNCLQRLMRLNNTQNTLDPIQKMTKGQHEELNEINSGQNNTQMDHDNKKSHVNQMGVFKKKPTFHQYMQSVRQNKNSKPYVEQKLSKEPPKVYDRGIATVSFIHSLQKEATKSYNQRYSQQSKLILPSQDPNQYPSYLNKKPKTYEASYEKHRLVRKPYVPPPSEGKVPEKIPHRYYSSLDQFSDPEYLLSDKANKRGDYKDLESTRKYIGVANMKFK